MTDQARVALADLAAQVTTGPVAVLDGLRMVPVPLVPEVRLFLAEDPIVWWARMEAEAGSVLTAPFWASAWIGGQAVARYVLDHPGLVAGRRVLDLAAGSGVAGIAAGMAGAAVVTANDIDPYALAAIELNARANGVEVAINGANLLADKHLRDADDADVVLAGDVFYDRAMAQAMLPFLNRAVARGARVLVGDPGRAEISRTDLRIVATYRAVSAVTFTDAEIKEVHVLEPVPRRGAGRDPRG